MSMLRSTDWGFVGFISLMVLIGVGAIAGVTYAEVQRKRDERACLSHWSACPSGYITVYMWPEERCFCALEVRP